MMGSFLELNLWQCEKNDRCIVSRGLHNYRGIRDYQVEGKLRGLR